MPLRLVIRWKNAMSFMLVLSAHLICLGDANVPATNSAPTPSSINKIDPNTVAAASAPIAPLATPPPLTNNPDKAGSVPNSNIVLSSDAFSTMDTLDNVHKLSLGDRCSFRIMEDQDDPKEPTDPKPLIVTDSGDVEVPYVGRFPALGKTCKVLAGELRKELEKEYYYQATVIIALDMVTKSAGKVYLVGQLRATGAVDIPGDEEFTISKAILRSGGFTEYADKRNVKLTRKADTGGKKTQTFIVNVSDIIEKGKTQGDLKLEPGDLIYVPSRLINF